MTLIRHRTHHNPTRGPSSLADHRRRRRGRRGHRRRDRCCIRREQHTLRRADSLARCSDHRRAGDPDTDRTSHNDPHTNDPHTNDPHRRLRRRGGASHRGDRSLRRRNRERHSGDVHRAGRLDRRRTDGRSTRARRRQRRAAFRPRSPTSTPTGANGCWLDPPVGPTVDDLVAAWANLPDLAATAAVDVTVDGYAGKQIEFTVPDYDRANARSAISRLGRPTGTAAWRRVSRLLGAGPQPAHPACGSSTSTAPAS